MAYNFDNEESTVLQTIEKNARGDSIRVTKIADKTTGETLSVDLRNFYLSDGGLKPTPKGIRIPIGLLEEVVETLNKLLEEEKQKKN